MFLEVHDNLLVAYSVESDSNQIKFSLRSAPEQPKCDHLIVFNEVAAHYFFTPLLPAIFYNISAEPAENILKEYWSIIEDGYNKSGWPGPWAESFSSATKFVAERKLSAFKVESTYGLYGWVLAGRVELSKKTVTARKR